MIIFTKLNKSKSSVFGEYRIGSLRDKIYIKTTLYGLKVAKNWEIERAKKVMKEIEIEAKKGKKSRAAELRERRKKQTLVQFIATPKAEENLKKLCENTGLNKTQVINKLLEEQEQLKLL